MTPRNFVPKYIVNLDGLIFRPCLSCHVIQELLDAYTKTLFILFICWFQVNLGASFWPPTFQILQLVYKVPSLSNVTMIVRLHENSNPIRIGRGIRQGETASAKRFITVLESAFKMLEWSEKGFTVRQPTASLGSFSQVGIKNTIFMTNLVPIVWYIAVGICEVEFVDKYPFLGHEIQISSDNQKC